MSVGRRFCSTSCRTTLPGTLYRTTLYIIPYRSKSHYTIHARRDLENVLRRTFASRLVPRRQGISPIKQVDNGNGRRGTFSPSISIRNGDSATGKYLGDYAVGRGGEDRRKPLPRPGQVGEKPAAAGCGEDCFLGDTLGTGKHLFSLFS